MGRQTDRRDIDTYFGTREKDEQTETEREEKERESTHIDMGEERHGLFRQFESERETNRQTDRQTDGQTDIKIDRDHTHFIDMDQERRIHSLERQRQKEPERDDRHTLQG